MPINSNYISDVQIGRITKKLNILLDDAELLDVYTRAAADLESDLSVRFVVPLVGAGTNNVGAAYTAANPWAIAKVSQTMIVKIRQILAGDNNRNTGVVLENGQKYLDLNESDYKKNIKDLLDITKVTGFQLNQFSEGAGEPVQTIGLAKGRDQFEIVRDRTIYEEHL